MKAGYQGSCGPPALDAAETAYYRACVATYQRDAQARVASWSQDTSDVAGIYRCVRELKLPELKRLAAQDAGPEVKGACFGLTAGRNKQPYVPSAASKVQSLIRMVRGHLKKTDPEFTFTSLQPTAAPPSKFGAIVSRMLIAPRTGRTAGQIVNIPFDRPRDCHNIASDLAALLGLRAADITSLRRQGRGLVAWLAPIDADASSILSDLIGPELTG